MVNTPFPHSLKSEAKKAAKILREFSMPNARVGPDKVIPADTIANAEGLAILSVFKLGLLITARGGSGIVIAKTEDGSWSAPSAIGIAGLGGGLEAGAEVTDFVIILNKRAAVEAFSKGGNLTLGGNFTVAAGPVGRNMEGDFAVRSKASIYTYSKTRGLFVGLSVEGSYLIERKDTNRKFYGDEVRAYDILSGDIERPGACFALYEVLDKHQRMYVSFQEAQLRKEVREGLEKGEYEEDPDYVDQRGEQREGSEKKTFMSKVRHSMRVKKKTKSNTKDRKTKLTRTASTKVTRTTQRSRLSEKPCHSDEEYGAVGGVDQEEPDEWDAPLRTRALWGFEGLLPCDLCFMPGDQITVLTRTDTQDDWWEGSLNGKIGIFPANYVEFL